MLKSSVTIVNKLGLHARAAAKLVALSSKFESHIELKHGTKTVNTKSIMGVMMLAAAKGTELELAIHGRDENEARIAIIELIENRFGEEE